MGQGKSVLQRKVKKLAILLTVGVLFIVPSFHVSADVYSLTTGQKFAMNHFNRYGFNIINATSETIKTTIPNTTIYGYIDADPANEYDGFFVYQGNTLLGNFSGYDSNGQITYGTNRTPCSGTCVLVVRHYEYNGGSNDQFWFTVKNQNIYSTITSNESYITWLEGGFNSYSAFTQENYVVFDPEDTLYISFLVNKWTNGNITIYQNPNGNQGTFTWELVNNTHMGYIQSGGGANDNRMVLYTYKINTTSRNMITIDYTSLAGLSDIHIIPIFVGVDKFLTDIDRSNMGLGDMTYMYIHGTDESKQSADSLEYKSNELWSSTSSYNQLEDGFNNDFNNAFNNIDFNNNFLGTSSLMNSMNWVRTQYNRMTSNNAIGSLIQYSLLFGLGLIVIGRQKK